MIIYKHEYKDRIVLELDENQFSLIAYLLEKSNQNSKKNGVVKNPIDAEMWEKCKKYMDEEM